MTLREIFFLEFVMTTLNRKDMLLSKRVEFGIYFHHLLRRSFDEGLMITCHIQF